MVEMKATDTLHISAVGSENLLAGAKFNVSEEDAKDLERRGLAKRTGEAKAEKAAPENKMEAAPENKGLISAKSVPAKRKGK